MSIFIPYFSGTYSGHLTYNIDTYTIPNSFQSYVESFEIVYDNIYDNKLSGFNNIKYLENTIDNSNVTGEISITLTNDLPHWLMQQLTQLAKACLSGGMSLILSDWVTDESYYCKWNNAGEFAENSPVICGGNMMLKFYHAGLINNYQNTYNTVGTIWQDTYSLTTSAHYQDRH